MTLVPKETYGYGWSFHFPEAVFHMATKRILSIFPIRQHRK